DVVRRPPDRGSPRPANRTAAPATRGRRHPPCAAGGRAQAPVICGPGTGGPMNEPTPGTTDPLPPREPDRAEACGRFGAAWKAAGPSGPGPRLEDHLGDAADSGRAALLHELVALE